MYVILNVFLIVNMNFIFSRVSIQEKQAIRKIESIGKDLIKTNAAVTFNQICIDNNLLPKFTNVRLYNEAVQQEPFTGEFRRNLVKHEQTTKRRRQAELQRQFTETRKRLTDDITDNALKESINATLDEQLDHYKRIIESRTQKKLCKLYGSWVPLPVPAEGFVNLSDVELSDSQKELLNLGLNFPYSRKFSRLEKEAELELLYQDICKLRQQNKITVNPDLREQLQAESTKNRGRFAKPSLPPRLKQAAKEIRENKDIIVRRADKAQVYVILNKADYLNKTNDILNDTTKFRKVRKNYSIDKSKTAANSLIDSANSHMTNKMDRIVGDFKPGYFYGNVKTHKDGNPLRPIISQIPLPTYRLAKKLNYILQPYVPTT